MRLSLLLIATASLVGCYATDANRAGPWATTDTGLTTDSWIWDTGPTDTTDPTDTDPDPDFDDRCLEEVSSSWVADLTKRGMEDRDPDGHSDFAYRVELAMPDGDDVDAESTPLFRPNVNWTFSVGFPEGMSSIVEDGQAEVCHVFATRASMYFGLIFHSGTVWACAGGAGGTPDSPDEQHEKPLYSGIDLGLDTAPAFFQGPGRLFVAGYHEPGSDMQELHFWLSYGDSTGTRGQTTVALSYDLAHAASSPTYLFGAPPYEEAQSGGLSDDEQVVAGYSGLTTPYAVVDNLMVFNRALTTTEMEIAGRVREGTEYEIEEIKESISHWLTLGEDIWPEVSDCKESVDASFEVGPAGNEEGKVYREYMPEQGPE